MCQTAESNGERSANFNILRNGVTNDFIVHLAWKIIRIRLLLVVDEYLGMPNNILKACYYLLPNILIALRNPKFSQRQ